MYLFTTNLFCSVSTVTNVLTHVVRAALLTCKGDADCWHLSEQDFSQCNHSAQAAAVMM